MRIARRSLLLAGALLPAAPLAARAAAALNGGSALLFHDRRIAESRAFAEAAAAMGHAARGAGAEDMVGQWRRHARQGAAVAGLTSYADMQIALGIAAEERRPVLLLAEHAGTGASVQHIVHRGRIQGLAEAGDAWPRLVAARLAGLAAAGTGGALPARNGGSLWTWMVAAAR